MCSRETVIPVGVAVFLFGEDRGRGRSYTGRGGVGAAMAAIEQELARGMQPFIVGSG